MTALQMPWPLSFSAVATTVSSQASPWTLKWATKTSFPCRVVYCSQRLVKLCFRPGKAQQCYKLPTGGKQFSLSQGARLRLTTLEGLGHLEARPPLAAKGPQLFICC